VNISGDVAVFLPSALLSPGPVYLAQASMVKLHIYKKTQSHRFNTTLCFDDPYHAKVSPLNMHVIASRSTMRGVAVKVTVVAAIGRVLKQTTAQLFL